MQNSFALWKPFIFSFRAFQVERRSLQIDCSESGTVNLPTVKRIIRLLTHPARVCVPGRKYSHQPWRFDGMFVAGRLQRSSMRYSIVTTRDRTPPPGRGGIKFILDNSCRESPVQTAVLRGSELSLAHAGSQVRMASPRFLRRYALYPVISSC